VKQMCTIERDGEIISSESYVAIIPEESGDAHIYYNADALTVGMAMQLCMRVFQELLSNLSEDEQAEINEVLGGSLDA